MKTLRHTLIALLTAATGLPALADDDYRHYDQHRDTYISHDKAADIAVQNVGSGRVVDVEFDRDWNGDHFEVEVIAADGREHDITIDAKSGKVLSAKIDR